HAPDRSELDPSGLVPMAAYRRWAIDTLSALLFAVARERKRSAAKGTYLYQATGQLVRTVQANMPYALTTSQTEAFDALQKMRAQTQRLNVLLQGDVGSGKTTVAALAAAHTLEQGLQVAILAPTEILARQLYGTFGEFF